MNYCGTLDYIGCYRINYLIGGYFQLPLFTVALAESTATESGIANIIQVLMTVIIVGTTEFPNQVKVVISYFLCDKRGISTEKIVKIFFSY